MPADPTESTLEGRLAARWRGALLRVSLAALVFATVTGSLLVFFGAFLRHRANVGELHWIVAAVAVPLWAIYLLRHYLRVRRAVRLIHFYVGLATFFVLLATVVSGVPLIFPQFAPRAQVLIDMIHIYTGFIVLMLLTAHLVLVTRLAGPLSREPAIRGEVRTTLLWLTLVVSLIATAAGIWLAL